MRGDGFGFAKDIQPILDRRCVSCHGEGKRLDLRGMRADQAQAEVERFLDKALLSGFSEVEIVHGRGTGALRRQIHDFLSSFPAVARFATAPEDRGGDGMTIVNLR